MIDNELDHGRNILFISMQSLNHEYLLTGYKNWRKTQKTLSKSNSHLATLNSKNNELLIYSYRNLHTNYDGAVIRILKFTKNVAYIL